MKTEKAKTIRVLHDSQNSRSAYEHSHITAMAHLELMNKKICNANVDFEHLNLRNLRNLVFQGGSVKGVAYGGAIAGLQSAFSKAGLEFEKKIRRVAGTSAGAITALALALGTSTQELVDIIGNTDFKSFLDTKAYEIISTVGSDSSSAPAKTSAAVSTIPLLTNSFGLASGQSFLEYCESFVKSRTNIDHLTFGELHQLVLQDRREKKDGISYRKDLFVIAYNLTLDCPTVFSHIDTPTTVISDAVRCSMSIPYVFVPHKQYVKNFVDGEYVRMEASEDLWIDGGITDNYPIWIFDKLLKDPYEATLGFYLVSAEEKLEIERKKNPAPSTGAIRREIKNILDYTKAVIETVISSQQTSAHKQSNDIPRTVYIDHLGTNMMNFGLSLKEKNALVASGWDCTVERCGLLHQVGKCELVIKEKTETVGKTENKDKESKDKQDSGPPSPDLDAATDTSPKCVVV